MKIPRLTMLTLGLADLKKATQFYKNVLDTTPNTSYDGVTFIELPGTRLSLYPPESPGIDISPEISTDRSGFTGKWPGGQCLGSRIIMN